MNGENRKDERQFVREMPVSFVLGPDQKMRWTFEYTLMRDPGPVLLAWKLSLLLLVFSSIAYFTFRFDSGFFDALLAALTWLGIGAAALTVLALLAVPILSLCKVGRRNLLFEMDTLGVHVITTRKTVSSTRIRSYLSILDGRMKGDPAETSALLLGGVDSTRYIVFGETRRIRPRPRRHHVELAMRRRKTRVYAAADQFEYVLAWIVRAAPKAKIL